MSEKRVEQLVKTWLSVVTPHVDYQCCYEAAKIGLSSGNELVSFRCLKCGAVYCEPVGLGRKLFAQHGFIACKHKWSKYTLVQGNPLAVLGCQLRDSILFVSMLPVDSSTLEVADHHSRCC